MKLKIGDEVICRPISGNADMVTAIVIGVSREEIQGRRGRRLLNVRVEPGTHFKAGDYNIYPEDLVPPRLDTHLPCPKTTSS